MMQGYKDSPPLGVRMPPEMNTTAPVREPEVHMGLSIAEGNISQIEEILKALFTRLDSVVRTAPCSPEKEIEGGSCAMGTRIAKINGRLNTLRRDIDYVLSNLEI